MSMQLMLTLIRREDFKKIDCILSFFLNFFKFFRFLRADFALMVFLEIANLL